MALFREAVKDIAEYVLNIIWKLSLKEIKHTLVVMYSLYLYFLGLSLLNNWLCRNHRIIINFINL